jgi:hypothetical protein
MSWSELFKGNKQLMVLTVLIFALIMNLFRVSSPSVQKSDVYASTLTILIPIIGIIGYTLLSSGTNVPFQLLALATVIGLLYVTFTYRVESYLVNLMQALLLLSIVMVALATVNNVMGQYINRLGIRSKFIVNLILYIPCLFSDFVAYMKTELGLTPSITFILLALEVVFIVLYLLVPKLFEITIQASNGTTIVGKPMFLDFETKPEFNADKLKVLPRVNEVGKVASMNNNNPYKTDTLRLNYSMSMWIFLNQQTHVTADASNIFSYGEETNGGYPQIQYIRVCPKTGNDMFQIKLYSGDAGFELTAPNQKWNNFVFTYNNNIVDLFVNGNLEKTVNRDKQHSQKNSIIKVGSDNGIYGAICNIRYFEVPLPKNTIVNMYNLLMAQNPPINNIV